MVGQRSAWQAAGQAKPRSTRLPPRSLFDGCSVLRSAARNTRALRLLFNNSSTAGSATIANNGILEFFDISTAGSARLINGATPVPNAALASAGAELRFLNGWSLGARFDGEFADRAQTYAGTGTLRYTW
jgi:hypothetical protein